MITRSKLVDQLRDYQIRSHHKWAKLTIFSPKPNLKQICVCRTDVNVARLLALLFGALVISSYVSLHYRYFRISIIIIAFGILLPTCLKISRKVRLARKRERRLLLPLSM
ncbi:hypothetical protein Syun_005028 [Stephania yunnanensis]|uniref:Uncharacterized protein n=1 Tax=Stephania yunnanensis TaxID=152371 RepID=A0AAP0Q5I2_9MAGN